MINKPIDLEERCEQFAEAVIDLLKKLTPTPINSRLITQCSASAGSVGANYCEAKEAESKKDFIHKLGISKKEIRETRYWLRLLARTDTSHIADFRILWQEASELLLIFSQSILTAKGRKNT